MRLADFILDNIEPILQAWEDFAKTITPASIGMDSVALRDHAEQMLRTIAAAPCSVLSKRPLTGLKPAPDRSGSRLAWVK